MSKFNVSWIDGGRAPVCPPDPRYPNGIALDVTHGSPFNCLVELPYPARRCGRYLIHCTRCELNAVVTTAGRRDDPCSVRLPCRITFNS